MKSYITIFIALLLCVKALTGVQAQSEDKVVIDNNIGTPTIAVTNLDITDKTLKMVYEIRNDSKQDIWVLVGFGKSGANAELFMDKDDRTILIRRRFDVPSSGRGNGIGYGRYVLLRAGQTVREVITLATPVNPEYGFMDRPLRPARGLEYATRLAIEIGFYDSDLPIRIRHTLEEADRIGKKPKNDNDRDRRFYFRGSLYFNALSEVLRQRDEEVFLPYTDQWFKGEKFIRATIDDLRIPYEEKEDRSRRYSLDMSSCTRVEIQCRPSILEYFFPYAGQQSLLSSAEKQDLQSLRTIVVDDPEGVKALAHDVRLGRHTSGIVRERTVAHVVCYREDECLMSFDIYNDWSIVTEGRYRFTSDEGLPSLRTLTRQIKPFELRVQCAAHLRNLWHRLRLYYKASGKIEMVYPTLTRWCNAMVPAYNSIIIDEGIGIGEIDIMRAYACPSAGSGKCHYAMNPNCEPDSPRDMVLLFETKAGWNQHGGPELFTFDNHDPKGGCVLLNDGTVKFIRTKEELQQLRWK
jgi:hypothetical protein